MGKIEKKKVALILSRVFPVTHSQAGKPTGFKESLQSGKKIHTVRASNNNAYWYKRIAEVVAGRKYLSVREWTGRPYNSEQRVLKEFDKVGMQKIIVTNSVEDPEPKCWVDGVQVPIYEVARNDGLKIDDFVEWFLSKTNVFEGVIIHFTDFRY